MQHVVYTERLFEGLNVLPSVYMLMEAIVGFGSYEIFRMSPIYYWETIINVGI